jgi:arsenate reductase
MPSARNTLRFYSYSGCSTCKKAQAFLKKNAVAFEEVAIVENPPTVAELKEMLAHQKGELRKLFNTSGQLYREMKISEKLPKLSEAEALKLLSQHGKLVKRPFALGKGVGLVGFSETEWRKQLT